MVRMRRKGEKIIIAIKDSVKSITLLKQLAYISYLSPFPGHKEAYDAYKDEIPDDKRDILETVVKYRESTSNKFRLLSDKRFVTSSPYINVLFKLSVFLGKF